MSPQAEFIERSLDNIASLLEVNPFAVEEARSHIRAENIASGKLPAAVWLGNVGDVVAIYRGPYFKFFQGDGTYYYASETGGKISGKIDIYTI